MRGVGHGPAAPRVVVVERGTTRFFEAPQIVRFWSSDKYTLFIADGAEHVISEPLSSLDVRLGHHGFLRVHRAELVNLGRVRALHTQRGRAVLELSDGQRARVSRRLLASLEAALGLSV